MNSGEHPYIGLRNRILAGMIVVPAVFFIVIIVIGYFYFTSNLQAQYIARMTRIVDSHRQLIDSFLAERKSDLAYLADTHRFEELSRPEVLNSVFSALQKKSEAFNDIGVFNREGLHVAYHGPYQLAGKNYHDTEWFQEVILRGYYVSDVFLGFRQSPHFVIAVLKDDGQHEPWVIRATIDSSQFSRVVEQIRVGKSGETYILNRAGRFQTVRRSGGALMAQDPDLGPEMEWTSGVKTFFRDDSRNETFLYATTPLNRGNWLLVARIEKAEAFKDLRRISYIVIVITLIGAGLIITIAFQVTKRIIGHMSAADTETRELGRQLIMASRLAEIGEMSSGFAHEINNPLQIIRSEQTLIETILKDMRERGEWPEGEDTAEVADSLNQIRHQVDRAGQITQGLLKFARQKESSLRPVPLPVFLPQSVRLLERKAEVEGIAIRQEVAEGLPDVLADPGQLEQVMINLLNNAIDAIVSQHGAMGGEIVIGARAGDSGPVEISVRDNGTGISPENMQKIMTPFFTTKPVGKGTGLGLSICYGIIAKMGGQMEISSQVGLGTTFFISLPRVQEA